MCIRDRYMGYQIVIAIMEWKAVQLLREKLQHKLQNTLSKVMFIWFFISSVLARYDIYSDTCFVVILYQCSHHAPLNPNKLSSKERIEQLDLFYAAFVILLYTSVLNIILQLLLFKTLARKSNNPVYFINRYAQICGLQEWLLFSTSLDRVSPGNGYLLFNRHIPMRIVIAFMKFVLEDTPQFIVQFIYLKRLHNLKANTIVYINIITSIAGIIGSLFGFLTARPSYITRDRVHHIITEYREKHPNETLRMKTKDLLVEFHSTPNFKLQCMLSFLYSTHPVYLYTHLSLIHI
eukprot:TRINITY_DN14426_c0_g1_i1.p1 TRINITY_DN14426_c0_g1~~TRINITY_DN14426_c0_g1_i1.p1  ORF type:complete len:311 (-),score=59.84 TRINITY_DN14426_c0_g1_i1:59-934(-)